MARVTRGLLALLALVAGVVGVPLALLALGGNPFPTDLSLGALRRALLTPDDGTVLIGLLTLVGWVAWFVFAISVVGEVVALASRRRITIRLPGFAAPQRFAAGLLLAVIAMLSAPMLSVPQLADTHLSSAPEAVSPAVVEPVEALAPEVAAPVVVVTPGPVVEATGGSGVVPKERVTHVVKVGDDLWSLSERFYGSGRDWRKIAAANPHVLSGGPDRLQPGWKLTIPDVKAPASNHGTVLVRRGDSLSAIAERELGSASQWSRIYDLNRSQLSDPDELAIGMRLKLPEDARSSTRDVRPSPRTPQPEKSSEPSSTPEGQPVPTPGPTATAPTLVPSAAPTPASTRPPVEKSDPTSSAESAAADSDPATVPVLPLAGVGGLLAAGLIAGLALRRRMQLQLRPIGRRIAQPPPPAQALEAAMGRRQRPLSLRTLDRATRAIAAHSRETGCALPPLQLAIVGDDELELVMARPCPDPPVGFVVRGRSWLLSRADASYLSSVPGMSDAGRPYPALVTLGCDLQKRQVLADVESIGLLQLRGSDPVLVEGVLAAMALELSFSPWADEMILTLVGPCERLPDALGKHNVNRTDDVEGLLTRLERRASVQREHGPQPVLGEHRINPDLADPWAPEILLINVELSVVQRVRLEAVVTGEPRVTTAAVVVDDGLAARWSMNLSGVTGSFAAVLQPTQLDLVPQHLDPVEAEGVLDLVEATGSELTTPAPWWGSDRAVPPDPPPDNITFLGKRFGGWGVDSETAEGEIVRAVQFGANGDIPHPSLQLLGPIELLGAAGTPPPRAGKQCLEYCAWLLENPGTTAQAMANALVVAEGTRRSNMSRLRGWLGSEAEGSPYLPDAYTGRIVLHPCVSSDWQRLQILTAAGVNRTGSETLRTALELVRGAPLADAAPGQWHWAEELRTDIVSCVRDIGVELAARALDAGDADLARWAAARALVAAPGDELLMAARIRTEHLAGNVAETERLTLQLAAQARALGVDLDAETVTLLQQVMEGRVRARMA